MMLTMIVLPALAAVVVVLAIRKWKREQNLYSSGDGWGCCLHCRGSWKDLQVHSTKYGQHSDCFPLCQFCWTSLGTPEARMHYYKKLWDYWQRQSSGRRPISEWDQIHATVRDGGWSIERIWQVDIGNKPRFTGHFVPWSIPKPYACLSYSLYKCMFVLMSPKGRKRMSITGWVISALAEL